MVTAFISGLLISLSIIFAIGAQNVFVLKQGIIKQHVFVVCVLCAVSDALLIIAGAYGLGLLLENNQIVIEIMRIIGVIFLLYYAWLSFKSAVKGHHALNINNAKHYSLAKTIIICLGTTWLNPHVYIDTVLLLGSIANQYMVNKLFFVCGAISASFIFFFTLGYGARILSPWFESYKTWKILDIIVAITMFSMALLLLFGFGFN